jgi:hypothetical protein
MQKFLVCPAIGGAAISFAAVKYLIRECGDGIDPLYRYMNDHPGEHVSESGGKVGFPGEGLYSPLLTEWWRLFSSRRITHGQELTFDDLVSDTTTLSFLWGEVARIRDMLVPFIERLDGHYAMFDIMNDKTPLRIVEVPDGYYCGVTEDSETGCEFVEEYPRIWHARSDDEYMAIAAVKRFVAHDASKGDWYQELKVYDLSTGGCGIRLVLSGKYGAARCVNGEGETKYLFLTRNEYYRATEDHPEKTIFEINDLAETRFTNSDPFVDADRVSAYARLVGLLEADAHTEKIVNGGEG